MTSTNPNSSRDSTIAASEGLASKTSNFFTVFVDKHVYGLDVKEAETIFKVGPITPIPLTHPEVSGFINLRGKIVVAVSLRRRLGIPETDGICEKFAISLEAANEHFALLVDRVGDVLALPASARTEIPPHYTSRQSLFTRDLYLYDSKLTPILDVSRLFDFSI
jgi:purine-binding chemotaxis protein CheW